MQLRYNYNNIKYSKRSYIFHAVYCIIFVYRKLKKYILEISGVLDIKEVELLALCT